MARPYLLTLFDELPDPRVERTRRHKLSDIFVIVLVGVICDCAGWDAMHDMVAAKRADFGDLLELPHGVPSADTLRRTIGALDPKAFSKVFTQWAAALAGGTNGKHVAIDGKTVRGAFEGEDGGGALHLVNAWVRENSMLLGQYACDVKSNEITAIPELIKLIRLENATVTIDAMGCQKGIARTLRERGAHYLFGLKGNHPTLYKEVLEAFDDATCAALERLPGATHTSHDKGHGRNETRRVWVQRDVDWLRRSDDWPDLAAVVLVETERTRRGTTSRERRAYIASVDANAERMSELVRGHWHVENKLHWVLDVTFGEDHARIAKRNGAENLSLVRKVALNLLQNAPRPGKTTSVAAKKRMATWRHDYLLKVLSSGIVEK